MQCKLLPFILGVVPVFAATLDNRATRPKTINSTVEEGIQTECKTCPYSLCTNKVAYEYDTSMVLTCWTEGTPINGDNTWLKTTDGCYVTQWDLIEYKGDYTKDLPYCGKIAQKITQKSSKTIYNTECNLTPTFVDPYDHVKMYKPQTSLTVTCQIKTDTSVVLKNPIWYKTLSNCYVPGAQIAAVDTNGLDSCGPVPFLEKKMREPDPPASAQSKVSTTSISKWEGSSTTSKRRSLAAHDLHKRWLYTTTIGFDNGICTEKPANKSKVLKKYEYGTRITPQCATWGGTNTGSQTAIIWLLTTDFCYIKDDLTDPQLIDDETRAERYPACEDFTDTKV